MKKFLVVLAILCCTFAIFAEGKNSISLKAVPYGIQIKSVDKAVQSTSSYGIGGELSYQRFLVKGLFIESGIGGDFMLIKGAKFANLMAFTGVGYKCTVKNFFTTIHADVAADLSYIYKTYTKAVGAKIGTGFGWNLDKVVSISLSVDATFTFFKAGASNGVHYRILPMAGLSFTF